MQIILHVVFCLTVNRYEIIIPAKKPIPPYRTVRNINMGVPTTLINTVFSGSSIGAVQ